MQGDKERFREREEFMPDGGRIVVVDDDDFFKVIPNVGWLSNDAVIEKIFRDAGFSVYVSRKKGLFWNYIYVYGLKFRKDIPYV